MGHARHDLPEGAGDLEETETRAAGRDEKKNQIILVLPGGSFDSGCTGCNADVRFSKTQPFK